MNKPVIKHENKTCPRCGTGFECKAGNILQCQCYGIVLTEAVREQLEQEYRDCLCRTCLETLRDSTSAQIPAE
jgi:hypothetical protein